MHLGMDAVTFNTLKLNISFFYAFFRTDSREDFTDEVEVMENGLPIRKNTTRSKIKILPSSEDDRARYTCEGRHPALSRPLRVGLQFSVQCKFFSLQKTKLRTKFAKFENKNGSVEY